MLAGNGKPGWMHVDDGLLPGRHRYHCEKTGQAKLPHVVPLCLCHLDPISLSGKLYLDLNGIIDYSLQTGAHGELQEICRFPSPFIQKCLYDSLTSDLIGDRLPILALDVLDALADVFGTDGLNLPALLTRYEAYLVRMKEKGFNPFRDQPRRTDLHYTEAVGHFHLYAWLKEAEFSIPVQDIS